MIRAAAVLLLAASLAAPAGAAERIVKMTMDGRPVDRHGGIAVLRNGVVYADVVDLVKTFDGLLTFQGPATVVTIGPATATFTIGSRTMKINDGAVTMRGPVFVRHGDPYVPLDAFIAHVTTARLAINPSRTTADISVDSGI